MNRRRRAGGRSWSLGSAAEAIAAVAGESTDTEWVAALARQLETVLELEQQAA